MSDIVHHHIKLPYIMAYDTQPLISLGEKKLFLNEAVEKDFILYMNTKHRDTLDALKAGKLDDNITDVIEKAAKEVSAKYN